MHRNHTDAPLKHRCALHCSNTLQKSKVAKDEVILWWCCNGGSMLWLRVKYPPVWDAATLKRLWEEQHTTMVSLFLTPPLPPILCISFFWRVQIFHSTSLARVTQSYNSNHNKSIRRCDQYKGHVIRLIQKRGLQKNWPHDLIRGGSHCTVMKKKTWQPFSLQSPQKTTILTSRQ